MRLHTPLAAALALGALACGSGQRDATIQARGETTANTDAFPVTLAAPNGRVEVARRPRRIVSLSPTATEMLFAIGADQQVVAVDDNSDYPREAPRTDLSGFEPNVEAVAGYDPDLVVASDDAGLAHGLQALDVPLLVQPAATTLADSYRQIEQLGVATGNVADAAREVARMRAEIGSVVDSTQESGRGLSYYHELDDTYFSATSNTFIGHVYGLVDLRNIADEAEGAASGYPQLSAEYIIEADPDLIFLADTECCNQSAATVARRPGWRQISAVRHDAVVELDDDVASRWGPRVVELLKVVAEAVDRLAAPKT
jgi:iron complex transport system substrate-binding protein